LSEEKKYNYTAADIEKYHKGLLSSKEMHEMERAALDDPFLADAIEGYRTTSVNASADVAGLEKTLQERVISGKVVGIPSKNSFQWWKIAAAIIVLGGAGFFVFKISSNSNDKAVAKLEEQKKEQPPATINDSVKVENNEAAPDTFTFNPKAAIATKRKFSRTFSLRKDSNDVTETMTSTYKMSKKDARQYDSLNKSTMFNAAAPVAKSELSENKELDGYYSNKKAFTLSNQPKMNYFHGRVTDVNNNPLPFANITNTHDNVGTYSDALGNFTLISPDTVLNVQVHSIGFENNLVDLKNNVAGNKIVLKDDTSAADKIISYQKPDTNRSRTGSLKFEEPEPADGWTNYDTYIANNLSKPGDQEVKYLNGHVEISFEVNKDGDPVNITVEKSLCQKCDEEAVRLVRQGPKWKKRNKKANRVTVVIPFDTNK
jgi:hypothetical protein